MFTSPPLPPPPALFPPLPSSHTFPQKVVEKGWHRHLHGSISPEIAEDIKILWEDESIQHVFNNDLSAATETTPYFFSHLDRISQPGYSPSIEDVLRFFFSFLFFSFFFFFFSLSSIPSHSSFNRARVKTTGVGEIQFQIADTIFRMVDVGGQRSERRKWIHCFENVTAVIFFIAMNEYNLT